MQKKIILLFLLFCVTFAIFAQEIKNDIIEVKYNKKSARKAMILSSLFPGAGQYYADKSSIFTYIFPAIELGLWAGYIYFNSEGKKLEDDYENYADAHYVRAYQEAAEDDIISDPMNNSSFYDEHFRLDDTNTQHFYEDIGKYNKYVFGWIDWFDIYARGDDGSFSSPEWVWVEDPEGNHMIGVEPMNTDSEYYVGNESTYDSANGRYSGYRQVYIGMRQDAEEKYDVGRYFSFGLVANHIASALHAVSLTRNYNRTYLTPSSKLEFKVAPLIVNNELTPAVFVQTRF